MEDPLVFNYVKEDLDKQWDWKKVSRHLWCPCKVVLVDGTGLLGLALILKVASAWEAFLIWLL